VACACPTQFTRSRIGSAVAGEQVRIEGAAHFLQEDRGEEIAERIVEVARR
jgi:pimeloyl-ACP methyl ester carboxylesterase